MKTTSAIRWHLASPSLDLGGLLQHGQIDGVKQAPHRGVSRVRLGELDVHVKHYGETVARWFRGHRARREYDITREVSRRGVPTLEAIAWGENETGSYLVTRTLPDAVDLADALQGPLAPHLRQAIARALGAFLARVHRAGVRHDDLHPGNVMTRLRAGKIELYLIDLHAVRLGPPLGWAAARANLVVLNRWFALRSSRTDRLRFWLAYRREANLTDVWGGPRVIEDMTRRSLARFVADRDRRCLGGNRHFHRIAGSHTRGHAVTGVDLAALLADPDEVVEAAAGNELKRSASSAVVELTARVNGTPTQAILKRVNATAWTDALASLFRPPSALHAYRMGHALRARGLPTPRPLAVWHRDWLGMATDGYLLLEKVPEARNLVEFLNALEGCPDERRTRMSGVIRELGWLVARLHDWNLSHRDMKAANVLVSPMAWTMGPRGVCEAGRDGGDHVWFVDLAGVRPHRRLSELRKARDLARLLVSFLADGRVTRTGRLRFLRAYLGRGAVGWKRWWKLVELATKAKVERNRRNDRMLG